MKLNIDPRIDRGDGKNMCQAIIDGEKLQSIRSYPIEAGTKLQIWAMTRGMKKGWYCDKCFHKGVDNLLSVHAEFTNEANIEMCGGRFRSYPKKLIDAVCTGNNPIMMLYEGIDWIAIDIGADEFGEGQELSIRADEELHDFAKADGFKTNKAFVDFFKPKLKEGEWKTFYVNYWKPDSAGQEGTE